MGKYFDLNVHIDKTVNLALALSLGLFFSSNVSLANGRVRKCYIKDNYNTYSDPTRREDSRVNTEAGLTDCRKVNESSYEVVVNGEHLYVHPSAIDIVRTRQLYSTVLSPSGSASEERSRAARMQMIRLGGPARLDNSYSPPSFTRVETNVETANSILPTSGLTVGLTVAKSEVPSGFGAGNRITTLESQSWVAVRGQPYQSSEFSCPAGLSKTRCENAQAINQDVELILTGKREFDRDNRNWYVEASYSHEGQNFTGWFDEKQTTLNPGEAEVRQQTAIRHQEAWRRLNEVARSEKNFTLQQSLLSQQARAETLARLRVRTEDFEVARDENAVSAPVCECKRASGCRVSSGYGPRTAFRTTNGRRSSSNHRAWDISGGQNTPIVAVKSGRVTSVGTRGGWGKTITIIDDNGLEIRYSHLASYSVRRGERVRSGEQIGRMGSTGNVTGPHLDIGFKLNGRHIDPGQYLSKSRSFLNQRCEVI